MQWLRLYDSVVDDPKVQRLDPPVFKVWINLLCIANRSEPRGLLPPISDLCFILRMTKPKLEKMLAQLAIANLIDAVDSETLAIHNWNKRQRSSDDIAKRVRKHRDDQDGNVTGHVTSNVTETPPEQRQNRTETETEQSTPKKAPTKKESLPRGFDRFWDAYPKHEDQKLAVDQWRRLDPDEALTETILVAIDRQKAGRKWQEGFVKAPHRWIRDKNWTDVVEPPRLIPLPLQTKEEAARARMLEALGR